MISQWGHWDSEPGSVRVRPSFRGLTIQALHYRKRFHAQQFVNIELVTHS